MAQQFFTNAISLFFHHLRVKTGALILFSVSSVASANSDSPTSAQAAQNPPWQTSLSMYGEAKLSAGFTHLPYANPNAPKGGVISTASNGNFDSLNPFILKGNTPWQLRFLPIAETLMGRSLDEPFSLYGLLAKQIRTPDDRSWVEFKLHPDATFSDQSAVTAEDVIWSFKTLGTLGHPRYHRFYQNIKTVEQTGPRQVKITFNTVNPELALLAGLRPILKKAQWKGLDFTQSGLDSIPITSGPYVITDVKPGRFIRLSRNSSYWGENIPFRKGTANFDHIDLEFFTNETAAFEAFKSGEISLARESSAARWSERYNFSRVENGDVIRSEIAHQRPSGMTGFAFNTRKPLLKDWRVREALITAFNFEFINETLTGSAQSRITSYWSNSPLGLAAGPASGRVLELLQPFTGQLLPGALEGYDLPQSKMQETDRSSIRKALSLFKNAGWTIDANGQLVNADNQPFVFSVLLQTGAQEPTAMMDIYAQSLERLGIKMMVEHVDAAQYKQRTETFDFDMVYYRVGLSLSPGNEQYKYFGQDAALKTGSRNSIGVSSSVVDELIHSILNSNSQEDFRASVKALDRVLMSGRYVIPTYQWTISRIAHDKRLKYPETLPIYGDWPGWEPDVWWWDAAAP